MRSRARQIDPRDGPQIWTGTLWNPAWFQEFDPDDIGSGELLSLREPDLIIDEQRALLAAGADAISTNTFGASPFSMTDGKADLAHQANFESARLARAAADEFSTPGCARYVIGSIGPTLHALSLFGGGDERFAQIQHSYLLQARALWHGGADLLHVEKCQDALNARAALLAIRQLEVELGHPVPKIVTAEILCPGTMLDRHTADAFYREVREFNPLVFGVQGRAPVVLAALANMTADIDAPLAIMADSFAVASAEQWFETPKSLSRQLAPLAADGRIAVIGIAIGADAEYVRALASAPRS